MEGGSSELPEDEERWKSLFLLNRVFITTCNIENSTILNVCEFLSMY